MFLIYRPANALRKRFLLESGFGPDSDGDFASPSRLVMIAGNATLKTPDSPQHKALQQTIRLVIARHLPDVSANEISSQVVDSVMVTRCLDSEIEKIEESERTRTEQRVRLTATD